jgi:hypothetical protein
MVRRTACSKCESVTRDDSTLPIGRQRATEYANEHAEHMIIVDSSETHLFRKFIAHEPFATTDMAIENTSPSVGYNGSRHGGVLCVRSQLSSNLIPT